MSLTDAGIRITNVQPINYLTDIQLPQLTHGRRRLIRLLSHIPDST